MQHDAVVIGSGPNGLVVANLLADEGWQVLVLEAQPTPGGAVRSDEEVRPGFIHDTFSSFYPLAAASPTIQGLGLERFGVEWVRAPSAVGHPLPGGRWALVHPRREDTAASLDEHGYALVEGALDPADVARRLDALHDLFAATPTGRNFFEAFHTQRIYAVFAKTRAFDDLAVHLADAEIGQANERRHGIDDRSQHCRDLAEAEEHDCRDEIDEARHGLHDVEHRQRDAPHQLALGKPDAHGHANGHRDEAGDQHQLLHPGDGGGGLRIGWSLRSGHGGCGD